MPLSINAHRSKTKICLDSYLRLPLSSRATSIHLTSLNEYGTVIISLTPSMKTLDMNTKMMLVLVFQPRWLGGPARADATRTAHK